MFTFKLRHKWCLSLVFAFLAITNSFAQTNQCNDNASGEITVGATCNPQTFNSTNNNDYWDNAASGACGESDLDDSWMWFTATSTSTTIEYNPAADSDPILTLFEGNCDANTMTSVVCSDNIGDGVAESVTYATTIGAVYRIRIQRWNDNANMNGTVCVYENTVTSTSPNDECADAISLTSNATCSYTAATLAGSTDSGITACTGTASADVWFSFVAVETLHTVTANTNFDGVVEVFDACNGTSLGCGDYPEEVELVGLTVGNTYLVRVYDYYGGVFADPAFDICVTHSIPGPDVSCYSVNSIAYNPDSYSAGTDIALDDDYFSNTIDIGFDFCFVGTTYNQLIVSANGSISFDITQAGNGSGYMIDPLPSTADPVVNSILCWHDIDPAKGGTVKYQVLGTAPNRRFVVSYHDVPHYDTNCPNMESTYQIKIFETTNDIEVHVETRTLCTVWDNGEGTIGISNSDGTSALTVAGYNDTAWSATNEAYSFTCSSCTIVLPVKFGKTKATCNDDQVDVEWVTYSEKDVDHFVVERSVDGKNFEGVSDVVSKGYENMTSTYHFVDQHPYKDAISYYRIKVVGVNGDVEYSEVMTTLCGEDTHLTFDVKPNPTRGDTHLKINLHSGEKVDIKVLSIDGKVLLENSKDLEVGFNDVVLDTHTLKPGVYLISVDNGKEKVMKKLVKI